MSHLETNLAIQIESAGLPSPLREYRAIEGRKYRFDFAWPERKLLIEVQGAIWVRGGHSTGAGITRDAEKLNLATLAGFKCLHLTSAHVMSGQALTWIKEALKCAA